MRSTCLALLLAFTPSSFAQDDVTPQQVEDAIEKGIKALKAMQDRNGVYPNDHMDQRPSNSATRCFNSTRLAAGGAASRGPMRRRKPSKGSPTRCSAASQCRSARRSTTRPCRRLRKRIARTDGLISQRPAIPTPAHGIATLRYSRPHILYDAKHRRVCGEPDWQLL